MTLSVHESGPSGEAARGHVVFLHAFPLDGSMWARQLGALPSGWRGLAPDLRGFGGTPLRALPGEVSTGKRIGGRIAAGAEPVLTMARLADDVAELIDSHAGGRAVVCGISMGGYVAFELWRRHPDRVQGLLLAGTRPGSDDDEARESRLRMAQTARARGVGPIAAAMIPSLLVGANHDRSLRLVEEVREMITGTPPETVIAALAGMAARHDSTSLLADISVPTTVVVGDGDAITPPAIARTMAAAIPNARLVEIPGAGHLSNLEMPREFNAALAELLGRV